MEHHAFEVDASYHQVHLLDDGLDGDLSDSWTQEAVDRLFAVATGTVGLGTLREGPVPLTVEIHQDEPPLDLDPWDHVVEGGIQTPSGRVIVMGCMDYLPDSPRIEVPPGTYRVRLSVGGADSVSEDGLSGKDKYRAQLWLGAEQPVLVHKQRSV